MTASTAPLSAAGRELPKRWLAIIATIWGGQAASMITSYAAGYAVVWYITETTGSAIMPMVMPAMSTTSPRVADSAFQPSRRFASTCWFSAVSSATATWRLS